MVNQKKLELAFKKYKKGHNFEGIKQDYEERTVDVQNIVDSNLIEKDHILLLSLEEIFRYYMSLWKRDVLVKGGHTIEPLKVMQMTAFYQCMGHDFYKVKYPKMRLEYSFGDVVRSLIHCSMFGWEKEESLLFDFIVHHLGDNLMPAKEWETHIWFLLELYLQYREKTILATNRQVHLAVIDKFREEGIPYGNIPEDLHLYAKVLEQWKDANDDEMQQFIVEMSEFHTGLVSEIDKMGEFGDYRYGFYPYEIIYLMHVRQKIGKPITNSLTDFLMDTPEAKLEFNNPEPYPEWDPVMRRIDDFYRRHYPEYLPNTYGSLFQ